MDAGSLGTGGNQEQGLWDQMGGMKGLQSGMNIAGGLYGMYGMHKQLGMAKESLGMAREDLGMRKDAAKQYSDFRNNTKQSFA